MEKPDRGVIDFAILVEEPHIAKYNYLCFPESDVWGVVMPKDCSLAEKENITAANLMGLPLFCSGQGWNKDIPPLVRQTD